MDLEDLEPRKTQPKPKDLESPGVEVLEAYLAELETEACSQCIPPSVGVRI